MSESPIEKAEEAVCNAIAKKAEAKDPAITDLPTAEGLKSLAEGVAAMKHGPQGGAYNYSGTYSSSSESTSKSHATGESTLHNVTHEGEERERPGATGFS